MNENKLRWLIDGLMAIKILWPGTTLARLVDATASIFLRRHALRTYSRSSSDHRSFKTLTLTPTKSLLYG